MDTTRRHVILTGGAIGAGLIASGLPGVSALAATPTVPVRRSLQGLAWNDPIVATYRDAVGILKAKPASDKLSWANLCSFHGGPSGYKYCPHGDWYFLPWHRAYTAMYERIVRSVTSAPEFALPFWDWTANPLMPEVFLTPTTPDGKPNPLYVNDNGVKRTWPSATPMPASIVGPAVLDRILTATPYEVFGTSRNLRQDSLDMAWVVRGGGTQGTLEATPHNNVHNNIGGWMPTAQSPRDPIFFMHHGNIDRIWALWNVTHANSTDPLWTGMRFTDNFLNPDGSFWSPKVSDLYDPETLGYSYGLEPLVAAAAAAPGPRTVALNAGLDAVIRASGAPVAGATVAFVANTATATATTPLSVDVVVPANAVEAIVRRAPTVSGMAASGAPRSSDDAAGPRALALLRDVEITDPQTTSFRVFIDQDGLSPDTPDSVPNYVGTFAVLDHGAGHGGAHRAPPSFVLDLTDAIQRVYGAGGAPARGVRLQLQPLSLVGGAIGTATPATVEIAVVSG